MEKFYYSITLLLYYSYLDRDTGMIRIMSRNYRCFNRPTNIFFHLLV